MTQSNIRQPLKHPKMRIKQSQNRVQPQQQQQQPPIEVNKKQSNENKQIQQVEQKVFQEGSINQNAPVADINLESVVIGDGQKQKALKFREKQLTQDLIGRRGNLKQRGGKVLNRFEDTEAGGNINEELLNKISMMDIPREYKLNPDEMVIL